MAPAHRAGHAERPEHLAALAWRIAVGIMGDRVAAVTILERVGESGLLAPTDDRDARLRLCARTVRAALEGCGATPGQDGPAGDDGLPYPAFGAGGERIGDQAYLTVDWSASPASTLCAGDARRVMNRVWRRLQPSSRAALILRDGEGLAVEVIADILGEPPGTVRQRIHRGRMALREALTRHFAGRLAGHGP